MSYTLESTNKKLIPSIRWHQTRDEIIIFIDIQNINKDLDNILKIENDKIIFDATINNNHYYMELILYNTINIDETNYTIEEKFVKVTLTKNNMIQWSSLLQDKNMYKNNIKVNWQNWNDSDDSEDEKQDHTSNMNQQFDFHKMMESMGGIGNMSSFMNNTENDNYNNEENYDNEEYYDSNNEEDNNEENNNNSFDYCQDCNN